MNYGLIVFSIMFKKKLPIIVIICFVFEFALWGGQEQLPASRPASIDEITQLFNLVIAQPPKRIRFVADIKIIQPSWTEGQIDDELKRINNFMQSRHRGLSQDKLAKLELVQSNAIVKAHSGERVLHIEEWYSGHFYRLDQTDEAAVPDSFLQTHTNKFYETFVNLHDPQFSPYMSFYVNRNLHAASLTRDPNVGYLEHNLWQALGIDSSIAFPIAMLMADTNSLISAVTSLKKTSAFYDYDIGNAGFDGLKIDPWKIQRIHDGADPNCHLDASDEIIDGIPTTRLTLRCKFPEMKSIDSIEIVCWIGRISEKTVCLQASLTNFTEHTSFFSQRQQFDDKGFPRIWNTYTLGKDSFKKELITFKEIDMDPSFSDAEIFTPKFQTNYSVSDVTSGQGVLLQSAPGMKNVTQAIIPSTRRFFFIVFFVLSIIPFALLYHYGKKR